MDNEFFRPYADELYNKDCGKRYYVYGREELADTPFFPFHTLDGGAFFFTNEHYGAADSETLLRKTLSGEVFDIFRDESGNLDWARSHHFCDSNGFYKMFEWESWPQRLYMIIPLAQKYMQTSDKFYSDMWYRIFHKWVEDSPYEPFNPEINHCLTDMKWRDMQVGWRTLTVIYSVFMLAKNNPFSKEQWKYIYDFLILSFDHLVLEVRNHIKQNEFGNHALQKGTALISGAVMFPEFERSKEYEQAGRDMIAFCHERAILPDGASNEASPSYSHFIAELYMEAEMCLERNGFAPFAGIRESLLRQYSLLARLATKNGRTLRFSDSYSMDAHADIARAGKIMGFEPDFTKESFASFDSGLAVLRNERFEVAFDAMDYFGGHQHAGRLQPLVFLDGLPLVTEVGCCNYDWLEMHAFAKTEQAHSAVSCDEFDFLSTLLTAHLVDFDKNSVQGESVSECGDKKFTWKRKIEIDETAVKITDEVSAESELPFTGRLYLAAGTTSVSGQWYMFAPVAKAGENEFCHISGKNPVRITSTEDLRLNLVPAMNDENKPDRLICLYWTKTDKHFTVETKIRIK